MSAPDWQASWHFTPDELRCRCGCGELEVEDAFLRRLNAARLIAGVPFTVTSGYRCAAHNAAVGGVACSAHRRGYGCDIATSSGVDRAAILRGLMAAGITRIGVYDAAHVHADTDPEKPPGVVWTGRS